MYVCHCQIAFLPGTFPTTQTGKLAHTFSFHKNVTFRAIYLGEKLDLLSCIDKFILKHVSILMHYRAEATERY